MSWINYAGGRFVLENSRNAIINMGPFVDEDDGKTLETELTITQSQIFLSKNDGAFAVIDASSFSTPTYDSAGYYRVGLNIYDTDTAGHLNVTILATGALPVWRTVEVETPVAPS